MLKPLFIDDGLRLVAKSLRTIKGGLVYKASLGALVVASLLIIYSTYFTIKSLQGTINRQEAHLSILQDRLSSMMQRDKVRFEHFNAEFDATKSQIRAMRSSVEELKGAAIILLGSSKKPRKVRNAKRP